MELQVIQQDGELTRVALSGKLDVAGEHEIGDRFRELVAASEGPMLVDLADVTYLASLGIRLLFAGAKSLSARNLKMVVINPQPMVEEVLLSSGTVKLIPVAEDEAEARKFLQ
jgi:anti-anti-sigma factor